MSRYIAKYMNLEKSKRPTFWNGGSSMDSSVKRIAFHFIIGFADGYIKSPTETLVTVFSFTRNNSYISDGYL